MTDPDLDIFTTSSHPRISGGVEHPDNCRHGLGEAGARRALAQRLEADAMIDLAAWIVASKDAGLGVSEISRLAGVTRQTVYTTLSQ